MGITAAITAATAVTANQASKNRKAASKAAKTQAELAQEAEVNRQQEAAAEAERIREAEDRRQQNIAMGAGEISSLFSQFNDDFYNKRATDYTNYALPQLDRQYQDEMRNLIAQLARSGNLNSSLRGDLTGKLQTQYNTQKMSIQDTANRYAMDARSQAEQARAQLLKSNSELADPGLIRTMAQAQAQGVGVAPQYQNLGQMIASLSNSIPEQTLGTKAATGGGVSLYNQNNTAGSGRLVS
jgi:DNA-binding XRE family transcriptional regulator